MQHLTALAQPLTVIGEVLPALERKGKDPAVWKQELLSKAETLSRTRVILNEWIGAVDAYRNFLQHEQSAIEWTRNRAQQQQQQLLLQQNLKAPPTAAAGQPNAPDAHRSVPSPLPVKAQAQHEQQQPSQAGPSPAMPAASEQDAMMQSQQSVEQPDASRKRPFPGPDDAELELELEPEL
uniref:Uncharacterized protein n=1 Tax=Chromera velia CCMP2878 TaxID=1169474 RepID=A0A0G4HFL4_9ALVE|eukprot:Cvel_27109.t1-p1 / transcript=Cvel_27109.t1 / gene=Cvel_27109 / organism=Chromera_velia_CCMP2878 / gene_product=hypothetical protein / transcript_product=hypothetical protein / location=Cvel_scaffold3325:10195-11795(+) / protein_length=179 / sequence_SO=supercontig / SO=protein_coding / is_pseudo=false